MRLLVVEDDERVLAALRDGLLRHGFEVACARTGAEAVALATAPAGPAPEVILLDLGLPDQDGFKVCEQIRRHCAAPIIMATARADVRSRVHGLNLGADDYVVKPYSLAELIARIHAVTRRGHLAADEPAAGTGPAPHVLDAVGVNITPGVGFGTHGEGYFRLSVTAPDARIAEAMKRMEKLSI